MAHLLFEDVDDFKMNSDAIIKEIDNNPISIDINLDGNLYSGSNRSFIHITSIQQNLDGAYQCISNFATPNENRNIH